MYGGEPTGGDGPPGLEERERARCSACPQRPHCLPAKLEGAALAAFEHSVIHLPTLPQGRTLVTEGEPFEFYYALKHGVFKAVRRDGNGDEQITAFHFPGTVLGLAERASLVWSATEVALTETRICRIPPRLITPSLQRRLCYLASAALRAEYERHLNLAHRDAAQRLATVLVHFAEVMGTLQLSLPMSRSDLASYLGLHPETLSRRFRELTLCGWIATHGRDIDIRDLEGLRRFAEG
ncbi:MAG TPA: Crp/Fnr family transcriptional regulator [Gammaproteobacteria bacterium]|nr:Crp/Fnr family transcriptional regulator [Gammaproteobacteria bacterium]